MCIRDRVYTISFLLLAAGTLFLFLAGIPGGKYLWHPANALKTPSPVEQILPTERSIPDLILLGAREEVKRKTRYDAAYQAISYPGGDVDPEQGACTDVIIRALRFADVYKRQAKAVSLYAIIIAAIASSSAIAYLYTWSLLGRVDLVDALWATISFTVFALLYGTITFALSAVVKSPMQAGGLTVLIFFLSGILNLLVSETGIRDFYPNTLLSEMALLACGQSTPGDAAIPLAVTLGLSAAILLLAGLRFQKIEL